MKQTYTLIQFSIVYTAKSNNPTILNPDFLKFNQIVGDDWELRSPPICTEPFAQVQFKNNVIITSQLDKIIFNINKIPIDDVALGIIHSVAKNYLNLIPHVNYIGVGINSNLLIESPKGVEPQEYLLDHFFKRKLSDSKMPIESLGLKFNIPINDESKCNLDFLPVQSVKDKKEPNKIMIAANFHRPINKNIDGKINFMNKIIDDYKSDLNQLKNNILPFFFKEE